MRVLLTTTPGSGHVGPTLPFATALRRAGHEVVVAVRRSGAGAIHRLGLPIWALDDPPPGPRDAVFEQVRDLHEDDANRRVVADVFARIDARAALPGVLAAYEAYRPDMVLSEQCEFAGPLAAERIGIPWARIGIGIAATESIVLARLAAAVDELRGEAGLRRDPHARRLRDARVLTLTPPCLEDPVTVGSPHTARFRELHTRRGALPDWWPGDERPLVYVTYGSVAPQMGAFPDAYLAAIEALASRDVRVLVTVGRDRDPADLGPLPAGVHAERWVPQAAVMPHAAAVVCHGGHGTVLGALAAGVPMVVLPLFADQPYNARRVERLGAGIALEGGREAFEHIGAAVERVLGDPVYRAGAAVVASDTRRLPPVDEAPAVLERLLDRQRMAA
jgi:UDP:flavonoid glycosyltransferase YjiC (YdhE family)